MNLSGVFLFIFTAFSLGRASQGLDTTHTPGRTQAERDQLCADNERLFSAWNQRALNVSFPVLHNEVDTCQSFFVPVIHANPLHSGINSDFVYSYWPIPTTCGSAKEWQWIMKNDMYALMLVPTGNSNYSSIFYGNEPAGNDITFCLSGRALSTQSDWMPMKIDIVTCDDFFENRSKYSPWGVHLAACPCGQDFSEMGTTCYDIDECLEEYGCPDHSHCVNTVGDYSCTCNNGYANALTGSAEVPKDGACTPSTSFTARNITFSSFNVDVTGISGRGIFTLNEVAEGASNFLVPVQRHSNREIIFEDLTVVKTISFDSLSPGSRYKLHAKFPETFPDPTSEEIITKCFCSVLEDGDDSGRPDNAIAFQKEGHVMFRFSDNSRCEDAYSFARLDLSLNNSQPEIFSSDYYYFSAQQCTKEPYSPGFQVSDNLKLSQLKVGSEYGYQIRAAARHPWRSSAPTTVLHVVRWQASIDGQVTLRKTTGGLPVKDVQVEYRMEDLDEAALPACDDPDAFGWCKTKTSPSGKFHIDISLVDPVLNNYDDFPIRMRFSKKTNNITHQFLCNEDSIDCTSKYGKDDELLSYNSSTVYLRHLDFDTPVRVTDDTTKSLRGRIYVASTSLPGDAKVGCAIPKAEVCLSDHSTRNKLQVQDPVCVYTNGFGEYELPAVIGTRVSPVVNYYEHAFEATNTENKIKFEQGIVIVADRNYEGLDLHDVTTTNVTIIVAAGLCNHNMGISDIRLSIQGCQWEGLLRSQHYHRAKYEVPAHRIRAMVQDVRGYTDNVSRSEIVDALALQEQTIDLRELEKEDEVSESGFLPQGIPNQQETNPGRQTQRRGKRIRRLQKDKEFDEDEEEENSPTFGPFSPFFIPSHIPISGSPSSPTYTPSDGTTGEPTADPKKFEKRPPVPESPNLSPSVAPFSLPSGSPSADPSQSPTAGPSQSPSVAPSFVPGSVPLEVPTLDPTMSTSLLASESPTEYVTVIFGQPSAVPTMPSSATPSGSFTSEPTPIIDDDNDASEFDDFKVVRFQYDGRDALRVRFGNEKQHCGAPSQPDSSYSFHVLGTLNLFELQVFAHQDFGYEDITVCTKFPPNTNVSVQTDVGVGINNTNDNAFLDLIKAKPENALIAQLLRVCSPNCIFPLEMDKNGANAHATKILVSGQPKPFGDATKSLTVTMLRSGVQHRADVLVTGDFERPGGGFYVPLPTHHPILVLRDPPGGGSYAFYENVVTTSRVIMEHYESFNGYDTGMDISIGVDVAAAICAGFGVESCNEIASIEGAGTYHSTLTGSGVTKLVDETSSSTFQTTWSYSTSTDEWIAGKASDMFLVPNMNAKFKEVTQVSFNENATGCVVIEEKLKFALQSPENKPAIAFLTRFDIDNVEIPNLIRLRDAAARNMTEMGCPTSILDATHGTSKECNVSIINHDVFNKAVDDWSMFLERHDNVTELAGRGGLDRIQPSGWFQRIKNKSDALSASSMPDVHYSSLIPKYLAETAQKVDGLESNPSQDNGQEQLKHINMIKFDGGGAEMRFELHEERVSEHIKLLGPKKDNWQSHNNGGWGGYAHYASIAMFDMHAHSHSTSGEDNRHHQQDGEGKQTRIGFVLADPDSGDNFDVEVFLDPEFGTFVFHTVGGRSKCPIEDNTVAREVPHIEVLPVSPILPLPDDPIVFKVKLTNLGISSSAFQLFTDHRKNPKMLNHVANGDTLTVPQQYDRIGANETVETLVEITRGPIDFDYGAFKLFFRSACENVRNIGDGNLLALGDKISTAEVNLYNVLDPSFPEGQQERVRFAEPCPGIEWSGKLAEQKSFQVNSRNGLASIMVQVRNPEAPRSTFASLTNRSRAKLVEATLFYRQVGSLDWQRALTEEGNAIEFTALPEMEYGTIEAEWSMARLQDGDYEIEARTMCEKSERIPAAFHSTATPRLTGVLDRVAPKVFGIPYPKSGGPLYPGDSFSFEFTETIQCARPYSFQVEVFVYSLIPDVIIDILDASKLVVVCEGRNIQVALNPEQVSINDLYDRNVTCSLTGIEDLYGNPSDPITNHAYLTTMTPTKGNESDAEEELPENNRRLIHFDDGISSSEDTVEHLLLLSERIARMEALLLQTHLVSVCAIALIIILAVVGIIILSKFGKDSNQQKKNKGHRPITNAPYYNQTV